MHNAHERTESPNHLSRTRRAAEPRGCKQAKAKKGGGREQQPHHIRTVKRMSMTQQRLAWATAAQADSWKQECRRLSR